MKSNLLPIAKESSKYIFTSGVVFLLAWILGFGKIAFLAFLISIFFLYVFRNPEREINPYEQGSIISPVDGVVVDIEEILDSDEYRVDIESSYFDVALLRVPFNATLESLEHIKGARLDSNAKDFYKLNEYATLNFRLDDLKQIKVIHRVKNSFAPLSLDLRVNQKLLCGSRYGYMLNGLTSIYTPRDSRLNIELGSRVEASSTIIGYIGG